MVEAIKPILRVPVRGNFFQQRLQFRQPGLNRIQQRLRLGIGHRLHSFEHLGEGEPVSRLINWNISAHFFGRESRARRSNSFASARRAFLLICLISSVAVQCVIPECPRFPPLPPSIFVLLCRITADSIRLRRMPRNMRVQAGLEMANLRADATEEPVPERRKLAERQRGAHLVHLIGLRASAQARCHRPS
jgi:hypothetical protein